MNQGLNIRPTCWLCLPMLLSACVFTDGGAKSGNTVSYAAEFRIIQIDASASAATQLAVHACAGLNNRKLGGSIFVQTDPDVAQARLDGAILGDELWLDTLNLQASATLTVADFLNECVAEFGGCLRYSYMNQQEILPAILTAAAALGVPPLADESPLTCPNPVLDATKVFAEKTTQLLSTQHVYENYLDQTSGIAMLNPGYNREDDDKADPDLIEDMPAVLIDFVFSRKLFVTYLVNEKWYP